MTEHDDSDEEHDDTVQVSKCMQSKSKKKVTKIPMSRPQNKTNDRSKDAT